MSPDPKRPTAIVYPNRIHCLICGLLSFHPQDIEHRYCGRCHLFHEQIVEAHAL